MNSRASFRQPTLAGRPGQGRTQFEKKMVALEIVVDRLAIVGRKRKPLHRRLLEALKARFSNDLDLSSNMSVTRDQGSLEFSSNPCVTRDRTYGRNGTV